jgi:hypothetical protein
MLPQNTLDILKSLSPEDVKSLGDFLKSPYFNSKETVVKLHKEIIRMHPDYKPEKFEYEKMYKKIYGGEFKEQTMKNLYSEFGGLLKKFIAHQNLEENESTFQLSLVNGLHERGAFAQSLKNIEVFKAKISEQKEKDEDDLLSLYLLDNVKNYDYIASGKFNLDDYHSNVNICIDRLICYFMEILFYYSREDLLVLKAYNVKKRKDFLKEAFLEAFDTEKFFKTDDSYFPSHSIKVRYLLFKYFFKDVTEEEFYELKKIIFENLSNFTDELKTECWGNLVTLILLKFVAKDKKFYNEAISISKYFDELDYFKSSPKAKISISLYRDVFGTALVVNDFEWAEYFINKYCSHLEGAVENERNYSLGRLSFQLKKYEQSLEYLSKVIFLQVYEKINVRFYLLMNYIELKSYQPAISMLNSIRQFYLESKEIPEMFAVLIESSLKFFREIIRAEENNKKLDYSVLKEAENAGRYFQKQYILNKIKQML